MLKSIETSQIVEILKTEDTSKNGKKKLANATLFWKVIPAEKELLINYINDDIAVKFFLEV